MASLAVLAALGVATGTLPWERWCSGGGLGFPQLCFRAGLWSGSASLFGLLAMVLGGLFVVLAITRRWVVSGKLPPAGAGLMAGFLAALAAKVVIVLDNAGQTHSAQSGLGPAAIGTWLGLAMLLIGVPLFLVALSGQAAARRAFAVTVAVWVTLGVLAIPYARSGLAWWGGPLASPKFLGGGNGEEMRAAPHVTAFFDGLLFVENRGQVPARLDSLEFVDPSSPFRVASTYVDAAACPGTISAATLSRCTVPLRGWDARPGPASDRPLGAAFQVPAPGTYQVGWFRIDYHVGPLPFEIFRTDRLTVCVPAPGQQRCPGPGLG